jgi:hypothetical protein
VAVPRRRRFKSFQIQQTHRAGETRAVASKKNFFSTLRNCSNTGIPRDRVASTRATEAQIRDRTQGESPVLETGHQVSSILTSLTKAPWRAQDKFAHHGNVAFLPLKAAPDGLGALTGWHFICTEEQCRFDSCHFHQFWISSATEHFPRGRGRKLKSFIQSAFRRVTQWLECLFYMENAGGSSPSVPTTTLENKASKASRVNIAERVW